MKEISILVLILFSQFSFSQTGDDDSKGILSNNNHYISTNFEFFAEEPSSFNTSRRINGGQQAADDIQKVDTFRKLGDGRNKIFVMPNVYMTYRNIAIYASDGDTLGRKIVLWKNKKREELRAKEPNTQFTTSVPALPIISSNGISINRIKVSEPKIEDLGINSWDVWFFISMQPDMLTKRDKEEMITTLGNLHYTNGDNTFRETLVGAYSFEPLSVVSPTIQVKMGEEILGEWSSAGLVSSESTYVIRTIGLSSATVRLLIDGLFSVEVNGSVTLSNDSFASLILDYSELSSIYGDYFYNQIIRTKTKKKRRFLKSSSSSSVYRYLKEEIESDARRGVVKGGSYFSRDSSISYADIVNVFNEMFPTQQSTIEQLLKSHQQALQEISANTDDDAELRKKIHEAYITYLNNAVSVEAEDKANEQFNSSLNGIAESSEDGRVKMGVAFVKFLKAGFSTGTASSNQETKVIRYINQDEFSTQQSKFTINSISSVSRGFHISRADFYQPYVRAVKDSQGNQIDPRELRRVIKPKIFDPGWVDPVPDWNKSESQIEKSLNLNILNEQSNISLIESVFRPLANSFSDYITQHDNLFHIEVRRNMTCEDASIMGVLTANGVEIGRTLELPWRNNETDISHVQSGEYKGKIRNDGALSWRIELDDTTRENIQIHRGNFKDNTQGCILLGTELINGICGVAESANAMARLEDEILAFSSKDNMSVPIEIKISIYD